MKTVLMTGAAGRIGTWLRSSLGDKYHFRCLDRLPIAGESDAVQADVEDFAAVLRAMPGVDAVLHLAAMTDPEQVWQGVLETGIAGTYHVLEAARQAGVKKVIYASTSAVLGWRELSLGQRVSASMPVHPTTLYGIGKATGEMLCRYFAEKHDISVVCLRIGFFHTDPPTPQGSGDDFLRAWCSPADLSQIVEKCLDAEGIAFDIFYAVSNNSRGLWDIGNARRRLGYEPQDNAEDWIQKREPTTRHGFDERQRLLFRAAVLPTSEALEGWRHWQKLMDLEQDELDTPTYRILPLIYHNLSTQDAEDRWMTKLKGVYRRTWLENQLRLQQAVEFVQKIQVQGIEVMLLDDAASILTLYDGQGARRLYSLDMLVRHQDLPALLELFRQWKVWPKVRYPERYLSVESPLEFWPTFEIPISIAWRSLPGIRTEHEAIEVWEGAVRGPAGDGQVLIPDRQTHFLRACWRATQVRLDVRPFVLIDLASMLLKKGDELDLHALVDLSRKSESVLLTRRTLEELIDIVPAPMAQQLLQMLLKERVTVWERLEERVLHRYVMDPGLLFRLIRRFLLYRRSVKVGGFVGPLRYMQYVWGEHGVRSLPGHALQYMRDFWPQSGPP